MFFRFSEFLFYFSKCGFGHAETHPDGKALYNETSAVNPLIKCRTPNNKKSNAETKCGTGIIFHHSNPNNVMIYHYDLPLHAERTTSTRKKTQNQNPSRRRNVQLRKVQLRERERTETRERERAAEEARKAVISRLSRERSARCQSLHIGSRPNLLLSWITIL